MRVSVHQERTIDHALLLSLVHQNKPEGNFIGPIVFVYKQQQQQLDAGSSQRKTIESITVRVSREYPAGS